MLVAPIICCLYIPREFIISDALLLYSSICSNREVSSCYHCFLTICARSSVSIIPQSSLNALCKFVLSKRLHIDKIRKRISVLNYVWLCSAKMFQMKGSTANNPFTSYLESRATIKVL